MVTMGRLNAGPSALKALDIEVPIFQAKND